MSRESKERLFWLKISKISAKWLSCWPKNGDFQSLPDPRPNNTPLLSLETHSVGWLGDTHNTQLDCKSSPPLKR
jgi:hypothetical protein